MILAPYSPSQDTLDSPSTLISESNESNILREAGLFNRVIRYLLDTKEIKIAPRVEECSMEIDYFNKGSEEAPVFVVNFAYPDDDSVAGESRVVNRIFRFSTEYHPSFHLTPYAESEIATIQEIVAQKYNYVLGEELLLQ